jgi:hypothetical protein
MSLRPPKLCRATQGLQVFLLVLYHDHAQGQLGWTEITKKRFLNFGHVPSAPAQGLGILGMRGTDCAMRIVPLSPATPSFAMSMLWDPLVKLYPALSWIAVLFEPDVLANRAYPPNAVLLTPTVLDTSA